MTEKEGGSIMYARVLRSHFKPDKVNEAARMFEESVIPLCRQQPGFRGAFFMKDAGSGDSVIITLWKNRDAMLASEKNRFFQEQVAKFVPFYREAPIRDAYEVILRDKVTTPKS
jgi:quinol monooxygenase YgiN